MEVLPDDVDWLGASRGLEHACFGIKAVGNSRR